MTGGFEALSVTEEVTQARTDDLWRTIKLVGQTGQADKVESLLGVFLISQVFRPHRSFPIPAASLIQTRASTVE